jgi:hypothetical protein
LLVGGLVLDVVQVEGCRIHRGSPGKGSETHTSTPPPQGVNPVRQALAARSGKPGTVRLGNAA